MMRGALMMLFVMMLVNLYPRRKENSILSFLFRLLAVMLVFIVASFGFTIETFKHCESFSTFKLLTDLCLIPLVSFFLLKIVIPDWVSLRKALLLLTPAIAFVIIYTATDNKVVLTLSFLYAALVATVVFVLIVFISIRYDRYLKNNFSNIDNMTVQWVRGVVFVFAAWCLAWGVIIKQDSRWLDSAYYVFLIDREKFNKDIRTNDCN